MKRTILVALAGAALACVVPPPQGGYNQGNQQSQGGYNQGNQQSQSGYNQGGSQAWVNGQVLSAEYAANAQIPAGRYWYDTRSGLWGLEGQAVAGVVQAGLPAAALDPNISGGNTGVFVNGRHLPTPEVSALSRLFQRQLPPGRYFLDANGDMGDEGGAPVINIVALMQQKQAQNNGGRAATSAPGGGGGGGSGGIWSRRNTNTIGNGNSKQGYVCTGGTCTTYGM